MDITVQAQRAADFSRRAVAHMRTVPFLSGMVSVVASITPLGWAVATSGVILLTAGLVGDWAEFVAVGIVALVVFLAALVWSIGRSGHRVNLSLERTRVTVGDRALGELTVNNPTTRSLPSTLVELPVGSGLATFFAPRLGADDHHSEPFGIATHQRGLITVGPATAVRGDALGLVRRTQTWSESTDLYIHPLTVPVNTSAIGFIRDVEGVTTQDLSSADVSFHALRDYMPGDDRRNIHWKTTARTGKLMVRQFEETRRAHLLLILDLDRDAWSEEDEFEEGVSAAASLVVATMRGSLEVSMLTQLGSLRTQTPTRALDSLSAVDVLDGAERLPELAGKAGAEVPQASVAVLITGSKTSMSTIHTAMTQMPLSMVVASVRLDGDGQLDLRTVGGFPVVSVPALDDFGMAVRKALG